MTTIDIKVAVLVLACLGCLFFGIGLGMTVIPAIIDRIVEKSVAKEKKMKDLKEKDNEQRRNG